MENKFNYAQQVFYGSKFALQLSVSRNGVFAEMAPCVKMFEKYDWDKKQTIKLSIDEICNIIFALESLNKYGEQGYLRAAAKICGKDDKGNEHHYVNVRTATTTIPFVKTHEFRYEKIAAIFGEKNVAVTTPILYILFVIFIIVAVSNGANLTDGIDGLATGVSAIIGVCLGVFAYVSGNYVFASYLGIMDIPNLGELSIFIGAFVGACVGFLWYNAYPAQVFMGDTGSLALGGIIASLAIIVRKELLIPIICGVFVVEVLSVTLQVWYFKRTKKKYGEGRRIFLMSPLHHHYQKKGYHESKIVTRFWIIGILLAIMSIVTLKLQ